MKIILDAMGGDNAPLAVLQGAAAAVKEYGVELILTGQENVICECAQKNKISLNCMEIVDCPEVIEMCDEPAMSIRRKRNSSLVTGLRLLKEGKGEAFVSAGSTGALHVGTSLIVRTIRGVKRPALATCVPTINKPYLLLDCGANVECRAVMLEAFGVMGSVYMSCVMGMKKPKVALVNNGAEESKGTPVYQEAHQLLKKNSNIYFVGNIEPRDIPLGKADVVVCDGFTGNVILKLSEGMAKSLLGMVKQVLSSGFRHKIGALMIKDGLYVLKDTMNSEKIGGAPFLGAAKPVIKAHGSSRALGIQNAIRQAKSCVETDLCGTMEHALEQIDKEKTKI